MVTRKWQSDVVAEILLILLVDARASAVPCTPCYHMNRWRVSSSAKLSSDHADSFGTWYAPVDPQACQVPGSRHALEKNDLIKWCHHVGHAQVDVRGVPIALKIARARARREQLKRSAEAEPAQALMRARRRLDAEAMQNEAARRAREDAVNKRLLFD